MSIDASMDAEARRPGMRDASPDGDGGLAAR